MTIFFIHAKKKRKKNNKIFIPYLMAGHKIEFITLHAVTNKYLLIK